MKPGPFDMGSATVKTLKRLLQVGTFYKRRSEENQIDPQDKKDSFSLSKTLSGQIAVKLILAGANTEARDTRKNAPLHFAAMFENMEIVEIVIDHGADVKSLNSNKASPLHLALANGNFKCGLNLACRETVNMTDDQGNTPLHVVHTLEENEDRWRYSQVHNNEADLPLHIAVKQKNPEIVDILLRHGLDANAVDMEANTPLHVVCRSASAYRYTKHEVSIVLQGILQMFLTNKGDINAQNKSGGSILHNAVKLQDETFAKELLVHEADVCIVNNEGETVLHSLAKTIKSSTTLIDLIQKHGGDVNATNKNGMTPLDVAVKCGRLSTHLRHAGAKFSGKSRYVGTTSILYPAFNFLHNLIFRTDVEDTSLHTAARAGDLMTMTELIQNGTSLGTRNRAGDTAMHLLASSYEGTISEEHETEFLEQVIQFPLQTIFSTNANGEIPMNIASRARNTCAVDLFERINEKEQLLRYSRVDYPQSNNYRRNRVRQHLPC